MTSLERFIAYFQAFEATYLDDDWSRLEPFFAPDVVYGITGDTPFACEIKGRAPFFEAMRKFLDGFDRKCTRAIKPVGAPKVEGENVRVGGVALYRRGDSEELVLELEILAEYRDGRIVRLTDHYAPGNTARVVAWMERNGEGLTASYV